MTIKKNTKHIKTCTNCFKPIYLKFNFSYITYEYDFNEKYQTQFLKRIKELSNETYVVASAWGKEKFFEFEEINIKKEIPPKFSERFSSKIYNNKLAIMRLYPNNNPIIGRVIGVMINKIFYIFYIDIGGKLYRHS